MLYRTILGDAWHRLDPSVQRFLEHTNTAHAVFDVHNGDWWLSRLAARLLGLPKPGMHLPVTLSLRKGVHETWTRQFPDVAMVSEQWTENGQLLEKKGVVVCVFDLAVAQGGLMFLHRRTLLQLLGLRLRLPRMLAPVVTGYCEPAVAGTRAHVSFWLPVARVVLTYAGIVQTEDR